VLAGLIMLVSILIATIGTHGRIPYFSVPSEQKETGLRQALAQVRRTYANRSLVALVFASIAANIATGLGNGLAVFLYTYFWGLTAAQFAGVFPGSFIGAVLGPLLAPQLAKRLGKKNSGVMLAVMAVLISMAPYLLRFLGWFPAGGSPLVVGLLIVTLITTTLGVAASVTIVSMLADLVEDNEVATGRRAEGLVLASNTFSNKCGSGVGILLSGLLVTAVHLPAHAQPGSVAPSIINNLVLLFLPINTALYLAWIILISRYRITREGHEENLRQLAQRAQSAAALEPSSDKAARQPDVLYAADPSQQTP